jgi:serine/threonine-protein phosphatase 2B catalytic subunit
MQGIDMTERLVASVPLPPPSRLEIRDVYKGAVPDWKLLMNHMHSGGFLAKELIVKLVSHAIKIFSEEENLVQVPDPVVFVGDIHG